jgi:hypothetical protein
MTGGAHRSGWVPSARGSTGPMERGGGLGKSGMARKVCAS